MPIDFRRPRSHATGPSSSTPRRSTPAETPDCTQATTERAAFRLKLAVGAFVTPRLTGLILEFAWRTLRALIDKRIIQCLKLPGVAVYTAALLKEAAVLPKLAPGTLSACLARVFSGLILVLKIDFAALDAFYLPFICLVLPNGAVFAAVQRYWVCRLGIKLARWALLARAGTDFIRKLTTRAEFARTLSFLVTVCAC